MPDHFLSVEEFLDAFLLAVVDGDAAVFAGAGLSRRSPRAWGWTGHQAHHPVHPGKIPTRVGMDRETWQVSELVHGDSHA